MGDQDAIFHAREVRVERHWRSDAQFQSKRAQGDRFDSRRALDEECFLGIDDVNVQRAMRKGETMMLEVAIVGTGPVGVMLDCESVPEVKVPMSWFNPVSSSRRFK